MLAWRCLYFSALAIKLKLSHTCKEKKSIKSCSFTENLKTMLIAPWNSFKIRFPQVAFGAWNMLGDFNDNTFDNTAV